MLLKASTRNTFRPRLLALSRSMSVITSGSSYYIVNIIFKYLKHSPASEHYRHCQLTFLYDMLDKIFSYFEHSLCPVKDIF